MCPMSVEDMVTEDDEQIDIGESLSIGTLFDELVFGHSIRLSFGNKSKFLTFRTRLYNYKAKNEDDFIALDILGGPKTLTITRDWTKPDSFCYMFMLIDKTDRAARYNFEILDDKEVERILAASKAKKND